MKTLILTISLLVSISTFAQHGNFGTCDNVPKNILIHAKLDAPFTLSKFNDVNIGWLDNYWENCLVEDDKISIRTWLMPVITPNESPDFEASVDHAESFDGCAIEYTYINGKLVKKVPFCS